ncbi:S8 family serine peptidase [Sphingosinicella terrae]|uniref:S8 family serine peptidase n=1 Tax=Sphingosinicella terrae TaxID=2172047 RepID=UPI000E0D365E|nr:S8 family serine peptidase [Sphingosinicella terrae]
MYRSVPSKLLTGAAFAAVTIASPAAAKIGLPLVSPPPPATTLAPLYGNIGAFYGNINPFYGNIGAFEGDIDSRYGNIGAFYGNIGAFYGNIGAFAGSLDPEYGNIGAFYGNIGAFDGSLDPLYGNIGAFEGAVDPEYGNIGAFYGNIGAFYGNIGAFDGIVDPSYGNIGAFDGDGYAQVVLYWNQFGQHWQGQQALWTDPTRTSDLQARFEQLVSSSEALWGPRIAAANGGSFQESFLAPLLERFGIDRADPSSLQALSAEDRARFFMEWHDGLMAYSGADQVDHWMGAVNWSPSLTQQQGSGADSIIGLLDATVTGDPDISDNLGFAGGHEALLHGHGVGVASLMVAAHDGRGVMGIAPNATVVAYNPFDATNTASWEDVQTGILALAARNASVINMSLGVSGYALHPDWRNVLFNDQVVAATKDRIFVIAAGNDGAVQPADMSWDFSRDPNMIIVGAVAPDGTISAMSNTPGTACLTSGLVCRQRLMDRFMVAPGELLLMPDGEGGMVRRSGTSFAAPLVSGAITLLHDRWPWLASHPDESVQIILRSARDLGAPGVDPVYGHGMLDVQASQSPLDFNSLQYYEVRNGKIVSRPAASLLTSGLDTTWETDGVYFQLYEPIGDTYRDFVVPVSSRLVGKVGTLAGAEEYFQRFATSRLTDWIRGGGAPFTETVGITRMVTANLQVTTSMGRLPSESALGFQGGDWAPHSEMRVANSAGFGFTAGFGNGGMALNAQDGLGLASDYGTQGGVNPVLGLASGGAFFGAQLPVAGNVSVSIGYTEQRLDHDRAPFRSDAERAAYHGVAPFQAEAVNVRVTHRASSRFSFSGAYARVDERNGLLGVQSRSALELGHGAVTDTLTLASTYRVSDRFTLAFSGTAGRTHSATPEQGYSTASDVLSSAFALSATFQNVVGRGDALRLSLAQPLHVERGELSYRSVQVLDRTTGELGIGEQRFDIADQDRAFSAELLYAAPILDNAGEIGLFGRAELRSGGGEDVNQMAAGGRISVRF